LTAYTEIERVVAICQRYITCTTASVPGGYPINFSVVARLFDNLSEAATFVTRRVLQTETQVTPSVRYEAQIAAGTFNRKISCTVVAYWTLNNAAVDAGDTTRTRREKLIRIRIDQYILATILHRLARGRDKSIADY